MKRVLLASCCAVTLLSSAASAEILSPNEYLFEADKIAYDQEFGIVVAVGDVEIVSQNERVKADVITVYERDQRIVAEGNVVIIDDEGNQFFTDSIILRGSKGEDVKIDNIQARMTDGSRLKGVQGKRVDGRYIRVDDVRYTPCKPCGITKDGEAKVPWSLNAEKVEHDKQAREYEYENAWMEFYGVPILWTPYFSHPDETVTQKDGFVKPTYGFKSDLGWVVGGAYYWGMDPFQDWTFGLRMTGDQGPIGDVEYRRRFDRGELFLKGSVTRSDERKDIAGTEQLIPDETRGHIEGRFVYHLDEKWRTGFDVFRTTDDQYARLYDYSNAQVYENKAYIERFDDRDYANAELLYFQDVRLGERRDQPAVLPTMEASFYTDPNYWLGGRFHGRTSFLQLYRGAGQDVTRLSAMGDWRRQFISDYGLVTDITASMQADAYYINERFNLNNDPNIDSSGFEGRLYPELHMVASYPFVNPFEHSQWVVEPIAGVTIGSDLNDQSDVPNEDSSDIVLDWSNLFLSNRFVGRDRVEDGTRLHYGLKTGLYTNGGSHFSLYGGQSFRLNNQTNLYPDNSGLAEGGSDLVGGVQVAFAPYMMLDYNIQMNNEEFVIRRHELKLSSSFGGLNTNMSYLYDRSAEGTNLDPVREQLLPAISWTFADNWRYNAAALYDFSPEQDGLVYASTSLHYFNDCLDIGFGVERNLVDEATGESDLEILFTLGFKNLGSFEGPSF